MEQNTGPELLKVILSPDSRAAIAGTMGGFARWGILRVGWREGIASVLIGCLCAYFLWPLGPQIMSLILRRTVESEGMAGVTGFLVGVGGVSILRIIIAYLQMRRAKYEIEGGDK